MTKVNSIATEVACILHKRVKNADKVHNLYEIALLLEEHNTKQNRKFTEKYLNYPALTKAKTGIPVR